MMNYFNALPFREALTQLGTCRFMDRSELLDGVEALRGKKIVIVGCGAQGLNQGLNLRDSGLDVSYALRDEAMSEKRPSWKSAIENGFKVGNYEELIPTADVVGNLTPDKQHASVIQAIVPKMKRGASLWYSHGFNIVEEGMKIRKDVTVVMMAPKGPGTEVRTEYVRGFGVPTLIAVHPENDPDGSGWAIAKALACGTGADRAGVLASSFVAEVKSDLMGEQTILCGLLQSGSLLCFDKMTDSGVNPAWAAKFVQYGWERITEALKFGGITGMMDRLSNPAKIKAAELSDELKSMMAPLFRKHQDDILSGKFSATMMKDWKDGDRELLAWREATGRTAFETTSPASEEIRDQEYFDKGILMVAFVKAGVELAFETMVSSGIKAESAYYESLHEVPLIANLISRKKLYEMNKVISDTAEYGCYLFDNTCRPMLEGFMRLVGTDVIGKGLSAEDALVSNRELVRVNEAIRNHPVEEVGRTLRAYMTAMRPALAG
ncbi:MAG: ketol-acid reductoisomerase [Spirochaetes bacterium]|nr:ketol-acid reductoisomerase [Spirochaetota bacterium]MBU1080804.1 ketol-acid reductoisomerase [Spirochaetota bacterium]